MIIPVIMAGGSGTRLWPMSRKMYPKQFLNLSGEETMIQQTLSRLDGLTLADPIIVCNEDHRFIVAEQLRQIGVEKPCIILEPEGKNTAPAIALAAIQSKKMNPDDLMLVLAADHLIDDTAAFKQAILTAQKVAETGQLVTFGIVPTAAETGYGYIQFAKQGDEDNHAVASFKEKPDAVTAQQYIDSGEYLWNSGMFMLSPSLYLDELNRYQPDIHQVCQKAFTGVEQDNDFLRINADVFSTCPDDSIDYAVMEKTTLARVVPLDAGWNDIGSWSSLWQVNDKDEDGNSIQGDVLTYQAKNNLVMSEGRLVAAIGVDDLMIVDTKDAVMIAHKDQSQHVKAIVDQLKKDKREESDFHRVVYRPWGTFDSVEQGERFKVKRIMVKPGAKLSLQMHHHRAEHWIVVSGTAKVTRGDETMMLSENQSTYIEIGMTHSLENPGVLPLEIIEIQTGSYLGEDDIVRFSDIYGRESN